MSTLSENSEVKRRERITYLSIKLNYIKLLMDITSAVPRNTNDRINIPIVLFRQMSNESCKNINIISVENELFTLLHGQN